MDVHNLIELIHITGRPGMSKKNQIKSSFISQFSLENTAAMLIYWLIMKSTNKTANLKSEKLTVFQECSF